jgi:hypothetical protein
MREPQLDPSLNQSPARPPTLVPVPQAGPSNLPIFHRNQDEQLNLLARAFEPYAAQDSSPSNLTRVSSNRNAAPPYGILRTPTDATSTNISAFQPAEDGEHDGSYGTLMLGQGGRSKYLGPTAGSEWLKDVCC